MPDTPSDAAERAGAEAAAKAADLGRAWAEHRDEVLEAARKAVAMRTAFARPADPAAEPSPPFAAPRRGPRA